jgi:hypothetical protein
MAAIAAAGALAVGQSLAVHPHHFLQSFLAISACMSHFRPRFELILFEQISNDAPQVRWLQ